MQGITPRRTLALAGAVAVASLASGAAPAHAVHLFPLTPAFDPLGHDCAQKLAPAPADSDATVGVVGFSFLDEAAPGSTTTVAAGESVTWRWLADHCHSVTFPDGSGTAGEPGFAPAQPQLVRMGDGDAFTVSFPEAGTFRYICVHHAAVGMSGTVVVTP